MQIDQPLMGKNVYVIDNWKISSCTNAQCNRARQITESMPNNIGLDHTECNLDQSAVHEHARISL